MCACVRSVISKTSIIASFVILVTLLVSISALCDPVDQENSCAVASRQTEREHYRATHLPWAVIDCPEQVGELIKNGQDVNATDEDGRTALHFAVLYNRYGIAKMLLDNGANVNVKEHSKECCFCGWGWYPLHLALRNENKDIIRLLVEHGADVNAVRSDGWPPLQTAAYHGQPDMIELLLAKGANANANKCEPMRYAIDLKKIDGALVMIKYGADVNTQTKFGRTLLHSAASVGNTAAVNKLIEYKAKIDAVDSKGRTPLYTAVYYGYLDIVKALVANGANVNVHAEGKSLLQLIQEGKQDFLKSTDPNKNNIKRDWYGIRRVLVRNGAKA